MNGQIDAVVDRRELPARIGKVLRICHRSDLAAQPPLANIISQASGERMGRIADAVAETITQTLPKLPKKIADRVAKAIEPRGGDDR